MEVENKIYHTTQPAGREDPQSVRPDGFPTPAHVMPKYLSRRAAIISLFIILGIFLILGGFDWVM